MASNQQHDVDGCFDRLDVDSKPNGIDIAKTIQDLSPTTQQSLSVLLSSISKGDGFIDYDAQGKQVIEYKEVKRNKFYDASQANVIAIPRTDDEVKLKIDACLELVKYLKTKKHLKTEKLSSGVLLDNTKIILSPSKEYLEDEDFEKTKKVLGSGNTAGDIIVLKDRKTGEEHAQKTMMISVFREDEIRCWVDMSDTGYVPSLYLFRIENNKVSMHMEILHKAITLRSVIDEHMRRIGEQDRSLIKPFSLYVMKGVLHAVSTLHQKGWAHRDLHAGNLMLQHDTDNLLKVKILDFGLAERFDSPLGLSFEGFRKDIGEVVRIFAALYTGEEFDNVRDARNNWRTKLNEAVEEGGELFCLIDCALQLVHPDDVQHYRNGHFNYAMKKEEDEIMRRVAAILFPQQEQDKHKTVPINVSDSVVQDMPDISHHDEADTLQTDGLVAIETEDTLDNIRMEFSVGSHC